MNSQMNKACTIAGDFNSIMTKDEENNCKLILFEKILDCYKKGIKTFYTNCEMGVPIYSAEILTSLKENFLIALKLVIPYEEQAVKWPEKWRERYYSIHEKADSVFQIDFHCGSDSYQKADRYMIDRSSNLICAENSRDSYIVGYAEKKGCQIDFF